MSDQIDLNYIQANLEVLMSSHHPSGGLQGANHQLEESRFASTIRTNKGNSRVQINTKLVIRDLEEKLIHEEE